MVTVLLIAIVILTIITVGCVGHIMKIQQQLELLDKEQHGQNKEIMDLMKDDQVIKEMLLQHIEVLKYLCEQDPKLNSNFILMGKRGEA